MIMKETITLAVLKEPENYKSLAEELEDIQVEVEHVKHIVVDGQINVLS